MATNVNFFFLFCLGYVFYLITSTDARQFKLNIDIPRDITMTEAAELLESELLGTNIPKDRLSCAIVDYFKYLYPLKNILAVSVAHKANFEGSQHARVQIQQSEDSISFDVYVFDEGKYVHIGPSGFTWSCLRGSYGLSGSRNKLFYKIG